MKINDPEDTFKSNINTYCQCTIVVRPISQKMNYVRNRIACHTLHVGLSHLFVYSSFPEQRQH